VILEMANHLLCFVSAVHVRLDELEFCPPGLSDDPFEVCAGLVISDVKIHREPLCSQASHDVIESGYTMFIRLCWEGLLQNQVPLRVISDHDILVARACANVEPPSVI
jgi:hypothetical protein